MVGIASWCYRKERETALLSAVGHQWERKASTFTEQNHRGLRNNCNVKFCYCIVLFALWCIFNTCLHSPEHCDKVVRQHYNAVTGHQFGSMLLLSSSIRESIFHVCLTEGPDLQHAHSTKSVFLGGEMGNQK